MPVCLGLMGRRFSPTFSNNQRQGSGFRQNKPSHPPPPLYMDTSCQLVHRAVRIYLPFGDQLDLCFKRLIANLFCKLSENFLSQQRKQFFTRYTESSSLIFA